MKDRIIIAPYGFKGTMDAADVAASVADLLARHGPDLVTCQLPLGDGGRGTTRAIVSARHGEFLETTATGADGRRRGCTVGRIGEEGVMEAAEAIALADVRPEERDPGRLTTRGVGELMLFLARRGCRAISVGLGDTATCDCGIGMLHALGYRFLDAAGHQLVPVGASLGAIARIEGRLDPMLRGVPIRVLCDVLNPLFGDDGAALLFSGQKGASPDEAEMLEEGGRGFAEVVRAALGVRLDAARGAGAAGGLGSAFAAFLGAELVGGADAVLDAVRFGELLADARLVITGEGGLDRKTLLGKGTGRVAIAARDAGVQCVIIAGKIEGERAALQRELGATILELGGKPSGREDAIARLAERLEATLPELLP